MNCAKCKCPIERGKKAHQVIGGYVSETDENDFAVDQGIGEYCVNCIEGDRGCAVNIAKPSSLIS